jgi:uncharacterized membrane protein YwaF
MSLFHADRQVRVRRPRIGTAEFSLAHPFSVVYFFFSFALPFGDSGRVLAFRGAVQYSITILLVGMRLVAASEGADDQIDNCYCS